MSIEHVKKIVEWAIHCSINYKVTFNASTKINHHDIVRKIITKYNWSGLQPMESSLQLIASNEKVNVVHFDFKQALYSILTDSNLMQKQNLLDTRHKAVESKVLDDLDTGYAFQNGIANYIKFPELEEYMPIVFWIDKTHTDVHGRLKLEPLMMTLGVFNRKTRNNPMAWRTLGYVTDIHGKGGSNKSHLRMQDYHNMLNIILETYRNAQTKPILWRFDGKVKAIRVPTLFVMGDTEGHDKLCGRMASRGKIEYLCRYCNIHREDIDDPFKSGQLILQTEVIKYCEKRILRN